MIEMNLGVSLLVDTELGGESLVGWLLSCRESILAIQFDLVFIILLLLLLLLLTC